MTMFKAIFHIPSYDDSVVPGEECKLIQLSDQVPAGGNVSSYEYADDWEGERVHKGEGP